MEALKPALALFVVATVSWLAAPVSAAPECDPPSGAGAVAEPWAQRRLDFRGVWKLSRGAGVVVAVVDSGVDGGPKSLHPQLADQVIQRIDLTGTLQRDCLGHGTAVAGIIAAEDLTGNDRPIPFAGVAPDARIISIKQTNAEQSGEVRRLADGIRRAADEGADVINVSIQAPDHPSLRAAVAHANAKDAVVIAAAGNLRGEDGPSRPAYPASLPDVLSVAGAAENGSLAGSSNAVSRVSVLAPGKGLTSTWPGRGYAPEPLEGTSFAAAYVSGVAALVRARHPRLNAAQVRHRIETTADGNSGKGTGAGMINPMQAVTAHVPDEGAAAGSQPVIAPPPAEPVEIGSREPVAAVATATALAVSIIAVLAAVAVVAGAVVMPMGTRRSWQSSRRRDSNDR